MTQDERWLTCYNEVKFFIGTNRRNPSKYYPEEKLMVHFLKRNRKLMNAGELQELNTLIHGALQSQHLAGEAADIYTDAGPQGNLELARIIVALGHFDQVILENVPGTSLMPQWVRVSWKRPSVGLNRRQILKKVMGPNSYLVIGKEVLGL